MALKIRRGTESQRETVTFAAGEIVWTTNGQKLYVGDGITAGGIDIAAQLGGTGITYNQTSGKLDIDLTNASTDTLSEGNNNLYFTADRSKAAAGTALVDGNSYNSGITFTYDDVHNRITAEVSPNLGLPTQSGQGGKFLTTNGSATSWASVQTSVSADSSPTLGGNLGLNGHNITGTGSINISGSLGAINTTAGLSWGTNTGETLNIAGKTDGSFGAASVVGLNIAAGNPTSPTNTAAGNVLGGYAIRGYYNGAWKPGVIMAASWDATADLTANAPASRFGVVTGSNTGTNTLSFDHTGLLSVPKFSVGDGSEAHPSIAFTTDGGVDTGLFHPADGVLCISTNATERVRVDTGGLRVVGFMKVGGFATGSLPSPPEAGMIVLDTTTNEFKGYNGSAWVVLG
jgi:hypothetical protein